MVLYWFIIPINDRFFMVFEIIGINSYLILIFFQRMGSGDSQMLKSFKN
jgi:hypothetical protein